MAIQPGRVQRNLKANKGRIVVAEQHLARLEKRVEKLEKQNAALKTEAQKREPMDPSPRLARLERHNANLTAALSKLRARVDQNERANKANNLAITSLNGLGEPIQALVRSFKQAPGAPFDAWRMWMLSTLRKRGVYRKRIFR